MIRTRAVRKTRCRPTATSRRLATASLAAAGLGLAACTTHTAGTPSPSTPTTRGPGASAATTAPAATAPAHAAPPSRETIPCAAERSWPTSPQQGSTAITTAPLYLVRAGQHACYDRVVFDLNGGEEVGYSVGYVPVVTADASGVPVPVEGQAALQVVIRGPIYGADAQGHQPGRQPPAVGADLVDVSGWASLAGVKFAGSFEGQTTVAVGVRAKRPFRVWVRSERDYRHVVVDIA